MPASFICRAWTLEDAVEHVARRRLIHQRHELLDDLVTLLHHHAAQLLGGLLRDIGEAARDTIDLSGEPGQSALVRGHCSGDVRVPRANHPLCRLQK